MTRHAAFVLLALAGSAAFAQDAGCDARTPAELRTVFTVAIGLNDALRLAGPDLDAADYVELHARVSAFDERRALPCVAVAVDVLAASRDAVLARSLLELATGPARPGSRVLPRMLARFLAAQPAEFQSALGSLPAVHRCALIETLESGWPEVRGADAGTTNGDALLATLKRVHCRAAAPKPATEAPRTRARDRRDPERRAARPRWA